MSYPVIRTQEWYEHNGTEADLERLINFYTDKANQMRGRLADLRARVVNAGQVTANGNITKGVRP